MRFFPLVWYPLCDAFERVTPSLHRAMALYSGDIGWRRAVLYGRTLLPAMASGVLLLFIDIARELPMTLILRPADSDTLAVRIYALVSEGLYAEAAVPAVVLLVVSACGYAVLSVVQRLGWWTR